MLVRGPDADDLVSDAFVKVLNVLLGGGGPDVAFRAYLLTAVRRLHVDRIRARAAGDHDRRPDALDAGVPFVDTAVAGFEGGAAARAFASLPERWQLVLWHLEVENQKPADIAPLLGMSAQLGLGAGLPRPRGPAPGVPDDAHTGDPGCDACRETQRPAGRLRAGRAVPARRRARSRTTSTAAARAPASTSSSPTSTPRSPACSARCVLGGAAAAYLGAGAAARPRVAGGVGVLLGGPGRRCGPGA